jgi:hypothetical protein
MEPDTEQPQLIEETSQTPQPGINVPNAEPAQLECPKCYRLFKNTSALRMHDARVHTKTIKTPGQLGQLPTKRSRAEELARKKEYQRKLRLRYKREGRDSRGYPLKDWREQRLARLNTQAGLGSATEKKVGFQWSPEQRAKFEATMKRKTKKRIQIVYPDPRDTTTAVTGVIASSGMRYCPTCGEHLENWIKQP